MAETVRSAMPVSQALTVGDRAFIGMDTYLDANKLQDGFCQRVTNLVSQNGSLVPRRGFQAQTTTGITYEYWNAIPVKSARNTATSAILCAADASGHTRFWKNDSLHGESVPIPMSASGTLAFSAISPSLVRFAQLGRYIYVAPGTGTSLPLRIDTNTKTQKLTSVALGSNTFTKTGHGLTTGDPFVIISGTVPSGLNLNTVYFVTHVPDANTFYAASTLPTSTSGGAVSNLSFTGSTSVDIVTTFKGETLPTVSGLTSNVPLAEKYPIVAEDIAATAHQTVTTSFALSSSAQLLSNNDFDSDASGATSITSWTQLTSGGSNCTKYTGGPAVGRPSSWNSSGSGGILQIDEGPYNGVYPGLFQQVSSLPTETYTIFGSNTIVEVACLYAATIRVIAVGAENTSNEWAIAFRIKGQDSSSNNIEGATAVAIIKPKISPRLDAWQEYTLIADFRAFKDKIGTGGKLRVEIQAITTINSSGSAQGIFVDYVRLQAIPSVPKTSTSDTAVDKVTGLVSIYGTKVNSATSPVAPNYGGYVKNRHFYYDVSSTYTVTLTSGSAVQTATSPATAPSDGTPVTFSNLGTITGISVNTTYYVVNSSGSSFGLATAPGGTAISLTGTTSTGRTMLAGNDWRQYDYLSMAFLPDERFRDIDNSFTLGLQNSADTIISWGGDATYDPVSGYVTFNLNTFASTRKNDIKAVYIRLNQDYLVSTEENAVAVPANTRLFSIGRLTLNGQLSQSGAYEYAFARWKSAPAYSTTTTNNSFVQTAPYTLSGSTETFFGGMESELSKPSLTVSTDNAESRIRLTLNGDFRNSTGDGYTHLMVYRRNVNSFPDGRFRLVAQIDVYPTTPVLKSARPGISFEGTPTQTSITLLDNLSDSELLFDGPQGRTGHIYRDGKDQFPAGCETVAIHQSRVWMSKGNSIYASWLLDVDNEYALYTTFTPIATDPLIGIKGAFFDVSGQYDNEAITAMVPFGGGDMTRSNSTSNALLVLRNNSMAPVVGSDARDFAILGFAAEPGAGCVAPLNARTVLGQAWWLGNNGINAYDNRKPVPISQQLDRLVNARSFNPLYSNGSNLTVNQTLRKQSSSVFFDNKFLFTLGQPGSGSIDTIYVFDLKSKGWYEWSSVTSGGNPKALYVLDSADDAPELYYAGANGHIYKYTGTADKLTAASAETTFSWSVLTRQYGQTYAQGQAYYANNFCSQIDLHVETVDTLPVTWKMFNHKQPVLYSTVFNAVPGAPIGQAVWTFSAGNNLVAVRNIPRDARGGTFAVELSGNSLTNNKSFRLSGILLHVSEGGIRRRN